MAFVGVDYFIFSLIMALVVVSAGFTDQSLLEAVAEYFFGGLPLVIKGLVFPMYLVLLGYLLLFADDGFWTSLYSSLVGVLGCFFLTYLGFLMVVMWASRIPLSDIRLVISEEFDSWTCLEQDCNGIRVSALLSSALSALLVHAFFGCLMRFVGRREDA